METEKQQNKEQKDKKTSMSNFRDAVVAAGAGIAAGTVSYGFGKNQSDEEIEELKEQIEQQQHTTIKEEPAEEVIPEENVVVVEPQPVNENEEPAPIASTEGIDFSTITEVPAAEEVVVQTEPVVTAEGEEVVLPEPVFTIPTTELIAKIDEPEFPSVEPSTVQEPTVPDCDPFPPVTEADITVSGPDIASTDIQNDVAGNIIQNDLTL